MHPPLATSSWHELPAWFATPLGERLLAEQAPQLAEIARRFHGDTLLWAGCQTALTETVRGCMVRNRLYTLCNSQAKRVAVANSEDDEGGVFQCQLHELPLPNGSLDAMVVHHGLEAADDPRTVVREIARVLCPGGRLVICGFNPLSLWGVRNLFGRLSNGGPSGLRFVSPARILDWLTVLGFDLSDGITYQAYGMPFLLGSGLIRAEAATQGSTRWHPRSWGRGLRDLLHRHRMPFGGVYMVVAVKQAAAVRPDMTPLAARPGKLAPVAYPKLSAWNRAERSD
jgi:SAM-dependent methyltransferase